MFTDVKHSPHLRFKSLIDSGGAVSPGFLRCSHEHETIEAAELCARDRNVDSILILGVGNDSRTFSVGYRPETEAARKFLFEPARGAAAN